MYLAVIASAFFNYANLLQNFIDGLHACCRVLEIYCVAQRELVTDTLTHKLASNGSLEDTFVELKYTLECVSMGPCGHDVTYLDPLVL